jgi:ABC-2 type transport system permease protein
VKALVMAGSALRRLARDRLAVFFIVLLPVVIILIIGLTFGDAASERLPVGVVDQGAGRLGGELRAGLEASPALDARGYDDADALGKAVRRGVVAAGVVVPAGYDQALRAGRPAEVTFVVDQTRPAPAPVRSAVAAVVARQAAEVKAARFAAEEAGSPFDAALPGPAPWPVARSGWRWRRPPSGAARTPCRPASTTPPRPTWSCSCSSPRWPGRPG